MPCLLKHGTEQNLVKIVHITDLDIQNFKFTLAFDHVIFGILASPDTVQIHLFKLSAFYHFQCFMLLIPRISHKQFYSVLHTILAQILCFPCTHFTRQRRRGIFSKDLKQLSILQNLQLRYNRLLSRNHTTALWNVIQLVIRRKKIRPTLAVIVPRRVSEIRLVGL
jgi:hypothetical protein